MDFADIHTIIIGEEGEYGRRLVRYLENHLPPSMHVYQFTTMEGVLSFEEKADIYLLEERFFGRLSDEEKELISRERSHLILLTCKEREDGFCKYHNPGKLLDKIKEILSKENALPETGDEDEYSSTKITMIYSPIYEENLLKIAKAIMKPGDLYLGAEDLGYQVNTSTNSGDMGDLCYYIHLREENILALLEDMLIEEEDKKILHSPDMYFYLRELTEEDYIWFFDKVKREGHYKEVFWGAGNGFVANLDIIRYFDQTILIDSKKNVRQNLFCDRLEQIMDAKELEQDAWKRVWREADNANKKKVVYSNKQRIIYLCLSIIFSIGMIGAAGLEIFFVYSGIQKGFTELLFRYSIGGMILTLTCVFGTVWSVGRIKAIKNINKNKEKEYVKENDSSEKRMIKTEVEWEADGEGTTILSGGNGVKDMSDSYLCPMLREEETGIIYLIKDCPFYIGSAGGNQLEIQDKTISREHAIILENRYIDGSEGYTIQDMDSTNGTWINGKKMRRGGQAKLKEGTVIRFAQKEYKFLLQDI